MVSNATVNYPLSGQNIPTEGDWWRFQKNYLVSGVIPDGSYTNPLQVQQTGGGTTAVIQVVNGRAILDGVYAEWGAGPYNFTIAANSSGSTRIDIVVIEVNYSTHSADIAVVQGTPGAGAPALTQLPANSSPPLSGVNQFPLAQITAANGFTGIGTANIADARTFAGVGAINHPTVASASTINPSGLTYLTRPAQLFIPISGTTTTQSILPAFGPNPPVGTLVRLKFLSTGVAFGGGNIVLNDTYTSTANGTITLIYDGTNWLELGRSLGRGPNANQIVATPNGAAGVPTLRNIVDADLPSTLTGKTFSSGCIFSGSATFNGSAIMGASQAVFVTDSGSNTRRALLLSGDNLQIGTIDTPASNGDVGIYRKATKAINVGGNATVASGVGIVLGNTGSGANATVDIEDSLTTNAQPMLRVFNQANSSTANGAWVGAGNGSGGTLMTWFTGAGGNLASVTHNGTTITYGVGSDKRLKKNIEPLDIGLARIKALRPSQFEWRGTEQHPEIDGRKDVGLIAQEVQKVIPQAVVQQDNGYLMLDYFKMQPYIIRSIQELADRLGRLESGSEDDLGVKRHGKLHSDDSRREPSPTTGSVSESPTE